MNRQFDQPAGAEVVTSVADTGASKTDRPRTHSLAERIIETSLDLILVVDPFGNLLRVSPSSVPILGYRPDEMIGRSAADFLYAADLEDTRNEMRLARRGRSTRNFECRYVHRDGHVVSLMWTGVWSEPDREYFFIGRDMTERIRLEAQLRQAQKMEAIGQLTGGIAHDFNNILTTIISTAELLGDEVAGTPRLAELVQCIDEAGERGAQLTHRLLAIARKHPLEVRTLDLNNIVGRMVAVLQRTLGEDITVKTAPAAGLWPTLADSSQLEDTILNLAVNARDAMPQGGQLVIETANAHLDDAYAAQNVDVPPGDYVALIVTDSGIGMPPEVIERAFEPFFTTKSAGQGTGLGLSMVYGFAKQMGGTSRSTASSVTERASGCTCPRRPACRRRSRCRPQSRTSGAAKRSSSSRTTQPCASSPSTSSRAWAIGCGRRKTGSARSIFSNHPSRSICCSPISSCRTV